MGNENSKGGNWPPQNEAAENDSAKKNHKLMGPNLQRKFAGGVNYNMKILIKGDRNTGKTCLLKRLEGGKFQPEYLPTPEIQVSHIDWNPKSNPNDIIKIEVWDIVDRGKVSNPRKGLKISNELEMEDPVFDAQWIDIYRGSHGVLLMVDITKQWTFDYCVKEIEKIPLDLPILILANFRDKEVERVVKPDDIQFWVDQWNGSEKRVHWVETSLLNGFGLHFIYQFLNFPFLKMQRNIFQKQLEINQSNLASTLTHLHSLALGPSQDYDCFLDKLHASANHIQDISASANQNTELFDSKPINSDCVSKDPEFSEWKKIALDSKRVTSSNSSHHHHPSVKPSSVSLDDFLPHQAISSSEKADSLADFFNESNPTPRV
eukprot:Sdes_comp18329_c0_seq1m8055